MQVGIFAPRKPRQHQQVLKAFAKGLKRHRVRYFWADLEKGWIPCDVAVTFGVAKKATDRGLQVGHIMESQRRHGGRHLVLELGFIHRERYYMAGWGGLNGRADFRNHCMPADRWFDLRVAVGRWREDGRHIVLCGQVPWDASVQHVDYPAWCREAAAALRRHSDRTIIFRPHPLQPNAIDMRGTDVQFSRHAQLRADLEGAWCVVTFNSNAGVEAAIEGVPVYACDRGSMALPIADTDLARVESPQMPNRSQWLADLAYTQWNCDEMKQGLVWQHLTRHDTQAEATPVPLSRSA